MKNINFYSFNERMPVHHEKISIINDLGLLNRATVVYPSKSSPGIFKESYYIIISIPGGQELSYKKEDMYCLGHNLLTSLQESEK